jgi:GAF domain-containing protein/HAMP domain-containing protein
VTQFRSPIIWRLILWFVLLSLIPIGIVVVFIQRDVRTAFINLNLNELSRSANQFSESFMLQYNAGQEINLRTENEDESVFVLTSDGIYFAHPNSEKIGKPASADFNAIILNQILGGSDKTLEDRELELLIATVHLPVDDLIAVVTTDSKPKIALLDGVSRSITTQLIFSLLITSLAGGAAILTVLNPLGGLANFANQVGQGNFDIQLDDTTYEGELSVLAKAFNSMTRQLKNLISGLEMRVAERTADLELARIQSEKRAGDLQAIGEISKIITGEQKLEILLPLITRLVSERFGFYHTGIFLLNETNQFAVLQAANSEGGKRMLNRGHKLEVGGSGIVGYVAEFGTARISLDVGLDSVFFDNPDLPDTRSEMALPLRVRDQIVGVLDVQSDKPGAFTESDTSTLSILADQIAIAIENARLFTQTQQALSEAQSIDRQNSREEWLTFSRVEATIGYHQSLKGGRKLTAAVESDQIRQAMNQGDVLVFNNDGGIQEPSIVVPLKLRGQIIGSLNIKAPTLDRRWSNDEVNLAEAISERLSLALENARLIQESQRQVIKEQTISEITGKIGASINLKSVLQTAVEELGRAMPGSEVMIEFSSDGK